MLVLPQYSAVISHCARLPASPTITKYIIVSVGHEGYDPSTYEFGFVNISILSGLCHFHSINTLGTRRQVSTPSRFNLAWLGIAYYF